MTEITTLTPQMALVLGILALTVFLFVSELLRVDVTAITIMVLLGLTELVAHEHIFSGFSSNAVISIIAVMIIGAGLDKTGVMNQVAKPIIRLAGNTESRLIAVISTTVGVISGFMQNVGAAALFLPAVKRISSRTGIPLSRLLMPMGFCAILGGTTTLIGSSPLILLNDLIESSNQNLPQGHPQIDTFNLFDVTPFGLALIVAGIAYFVIAGKYVLPAVSGKADDGRNTMDFIRKNYQLEGDIFEARVKSDSTLVGTTTEYIRQKSDRKLNLIARHRGKDTKFAPPSDAEMNAGDLLGLVGKEEDVNSFCEKYGLELRPQLSVLADSLSPNYSGIAEVIIAPRSSLIGKTTREIRFRQRYRASVLAVTQGEQTITEHITEHVLRSGDTLLLHCRWEDLALLDSDSDFIVITDYPKQDLELRPEKVRYAVAFFALALGMVLFTNIKLSVALMTGAIGMVLTGVMRIDEAYKSVDWRTVFLLASLIPLGIAVDRTGTAAWIAQNVMAALGNPPTVVLLTVVALLATIFTLVMSNVGATVLLVPLAVEMAIAGDADPRSFALVVGLATSNSFLLPTHQVNALIMGPGGYRNKDFLRAGGIMTILFLVVLIGTISLFY